MSKICVQRMKEDARRIDDLLHLQVDPNFESEIKEFVAQEIKEKMDDYIRTWNLLIYYFEKSPEIKQSPTVKEIHISLMQKMAPKNEIVTQSADQLEQILIEDLNVSPEEELDSIHSLLNLYSDIIKRRGEMESQIVAATSTKIESKPETEIALTKEADLIQTTKDIFQLHELFKEPKPAELVSKVISCKKCSRIIPDLPYCPYCGNKTNEEESKPIITQKTANIDEQLNKPKIVNKIEEENETRITQDTKTVSNVKEVPRRLRAISEIVIDLIISIGLVVLVSGIYILTRIQDPVSVSSDIIYQVVISILDNLPGVPFSINLAKQLDISVLGFYTIIVGLTTLWVGYGLWKRIYRAQISSIVLYSFALIADIINIMYYKLVNTPIGVFVSLIELTIIGILTFGDFRSEMSEKMITMV